MKQAPLFFLYDLGDCYSVSNVTVTVGIFFNALQPLKISFPTSLSVLGNVIFLSFLQLLKAPSRMKSTLSETVTDLRFEQFAKAFTPIIPTLSGMMTD